MPNGALPVENPTSYRGGAVDSRWTGKICVQAPSTLFDPAQHIADY